MLNMNLQFFAHKKGVGSTKNGRDSESKRLGAKRADGQHIYDDICMGNVTKNFTKRKRPSDLWNTFFFFYKFLIHVHASSIHDWHSG